MKNRIFYNELAENYNSMISFEEALPRRIELLSKFVLPEYGTAADLGCGSGIDSITLSKAGLRVVAFDPSEEMINLARSKSIEHNAKNIKFSHYKIHRIPKEYYNRFDLMTSLGNTLSNIPESELTQTLLTMYRLLRKNGSVVIQMINYGKLIEEEERILRINQIDSQTFIRFYDFLERKINFNILSFETDNPSKRKLITTEVFHYKAESLLKQLASVGFSDVAAYGDLHQTPFKEAESHDLVLLARK